MDTLKNKKIFISGGAGVIGRYLVQQLLHAGNTIFVGDLQKKPHDWDNSILYRQGDLNKITKAELQEFAPEYFFHLAATFERSTEEYCFWEENYHHNVHLSNTLLSHLKNLPSLERVVFASSYLIYDPALYLHESPATKPIILQETDRINPRNLCGVAKLFHEYELQFLSHFPQTNFSAVSARIFRSYGKNSRDIISRWIRTLLKNEPITAYRTKGIFDYIYAEDVAKGLIKLALSNATGIVNLGSGNARSVATLLQILKKHFPDMKTVGADSDISYEASQANMEKFQAITDWLPEKQLENAIPEIIAFEKTNKSASQTNTINVLITSSSQKIPLIHSVKRAYKKLGMQGFVHGGDSNKNSLSQHFVDLFWHMPRIDELSVETLINYCKTHNITAIIPSRDGELLFFAKHKKILEQNNIYVMISNENAIIVCLDKLLFFKYLQKEPFPVITTSKNIDDIASETYVVKEQFGASSKNLGLNLSKDDALRHAKTLDAPIFQPYIPGQEFSIDLYTTKTGSVQGCVVRSRDYVVDGESQITTIQTNKTLESVCSAIAQHLQLYGHVVFQAIVDANENIHIIECNSRFGGASTLSVAAGLESFYWFLLESQGASLDNKAYSFIPAQKKHSQIRYKKDSVIFVD